MNVLGLETPIESPITSSLRSETESAKSIQHHGSIAPSRIESKTEYDGASTILEMQMNGSVKFDKLLKQRREWELDQKERDEIIDEASEEYFETLPAEFDKSRQSDRGRQMLTEAPKLETIRRNKEQIQIQAMDLKAADDDESILDGISATYRSKLPVATQVQVNRWDHDHSMRLYGQSKAVKDDEVESLEDNRAVEVLSRR